MMINNSNFIHFKTKSDLFSFIFLFILDSLRNISGATIKKMETKIQRILLKYISIYDQLYSVYLQNNDSEEGFEFKREMNQYIFSEMWWW